MKAIQIIGLICLAGMFAFQGVTILRDPHREADKLFKQYADFRIWANRAQRKHLGGTTLIEIPSSEMVKPYKSKAAHVIAYVHLIGAAAMIVGEQMMIIPLAFIHIITAFMRHNHFNVDPIGAQVKHDNFKREFWIDMAVFFMLVHVGFS